MKPRSLITSLALAGTVFASTLAQAGVCVDRDSETGKMEVHIYEGCVSSHVRAKPHTLKVDLDETTATINVSGKFRSHAPSILMLPGCGSGGGQSLKLVLPVSDLRRYKIVWGKTQVGVANFLNNTGDICALVERQRQEQDELFKIEWNHIDKSIFRKTPDLAELIEQVTATFPATPFGRPSLTIDVRPTKTRQTRNWGVDVDVTAYGPLDENLDGQHTVIRAVREWNGWSVEYALQRYMCSSGPNAGQWTHETC